MPSSVFGGAQGSFRTTSPSRVPSRLGAGQMKTPPSAVSNSRSLIHFPSNILLGFSPTSDQKSRSSTSR